MKDYYSILGLDPDASPDSIKLAYRRLAREAHPDKVGGHDGAAQAAASSRMAELNEAYATLSDTLKRKDYEEEFRRFQAGVAVEAPPAPVPEPEPQPAVSRVRARPATGVASNVVRQAADQMHASLLAGGKFDWRARRIEGFDWALQANFLLANYFVMLRGFATADLASAQKFINYATLAIEKSRSIKRNHFLLLLPFQRMSQPEQVLAACRRFAGGEITDLQGARVQIVLFDVSHGRRVPCGPKIDDKRFNEILHHL